MDIIYGLIAAAVICPLCLWKKALTVSGAVAAAFVILVISAGGGIEWAAVLIFAFLFIAVADKIAGRGQKKSHSARNFMQVFQNGAPAAACAILYGFTGRVGFAWAFVAALGEALSDCLASDVGVLSRREPISIVTLRKVPRGTSGGVSIYGTLWGIIGAAAVAGFGVWLIGLEWRHMWLAVLLPVLGMALDSLLGGTVQARYKCAVCGKITEKRFHCDCQCFTHSGVRWLDNGMVNLVANTLTAAVAAAVFAVI